MLPARYRSSLHCGGFRLVYLFGLLAAAQFLTAQASGNTEPIVAAGDDQYSDWPVDDEVPFVSIALAGGVTDDGLPAPPASVTVAWSVVSGPGSVGFSDANALATNATFDRSGVYVLRLTADDGELQAHDELTVTFNGKPQVAAGQDRHVWPLENVALNGIVTDDGFPNPPAAVTVTWSLVSGPGVASFADANALATTVTFSEAGIYVLRLTADDGSLEAADELTLTLLTEPEVYAGVDRFHWPLDDVPLRGKATDDGLPDPPGLLSVTWSAVSGPGSVSFADFSDVETTASFTDPGEYVLRLTADDGAFQAADEATVIVNAPPTADAGADWLITWPASINLNALTADDGYPGPANAVAVTWSVLSGPGPVEFADANAAATSASFSIGGSYVLQLKVDDGVLFGWDYVTVFVDKLRQSPDPGSVSLSWDLPTEYIDGTPLTDLAGSRIHYGATPEQLPYAITIADPAITNHTIASLNYGTWYFALSAYTDSFAESELDLQPIAAVEIFPDANADDVPDNCAYVADRPLLAGSNYTVSSQIDTDGDGVNDFCDNCVYVPNTAQRDADADGHGNHCDGDFNNDGIINSLDIGIFKTFFLTSNPEVDLNSDGLVNSLDVGLFKKIFLQAPGETGLTSDLSNLPAMPDAGPDQTVAVTETVTLDATSSTDGDGDQLGFLWELTTVPEGSTATLSDPLALQPVFVADLPGTYVAQLKVSDGTAAQGPDAVVIDTVNSAPVSNAGASQVALVGGTVQLDGTNATDADGDAINYTWALISKPAGSSAVLSDPFAVRPSFAADLAGDYVAQLIVSDGIAAGDPDEVIISTVNGIPLASAGIDQPVAVTDTVQLDGTASYDPDGSQLNYAWALVARPAGSAAILDDPNVAEPSFSVDIAGTYVAQVTVNDGTADSAPDTAVVTSANVRPVAIAGPDQSGVGNVAIVLDGSGSHDPDAGLLSWQWALLYRPAGSTADLVSPNVSNPTLTPDLPGLYVVQLIVADAALASVPDTLTIEVPEPDPGGN